MKRHRRAAALQETTENKKSFRVFFQTPAALNEEQDFEI